MLNNLNIEGAGVLLTKLIRCRWIHYLSLLFNLTSQAKDIRNGCVFMEGFFFCFLYIMLQSCGRSN
jgi:hypothetical protein